MMEKAIPVGSWDFHMVPTAMVKLANGLLRGGDRSRLLEKRAADHCFADLIDKVAWFEGDIPIHTIGIGATEAFGCNRNGDGFNEDTCRKQASTFVGRPLKDWTKLAHNGARFFRHHKNKDPEQSYGYVKAAVYNERMRRIELLLVGNGTKEAAERNGGLVLPDSTRDLLERGEDMPGSMACKVAYDVCQNCFHKAASPAHYCTADTCISPHDGFRGLGCRFGLTKLADNGRQQYVENPGACFFDWSEVVRPADRSAYGGKADYMFKAASETYILGGAELAAQFATQNGYGFSYNWNLPLQDKLAMCRQLVANLAHLEQEYATPTASDCLLARAFDPSMQPSVDLSPLGPVGSMKMASSLQALAERGVLLTLPDFLCLVSGASGEKLAHYAATVSRYLPGVYSRLHADASLDHQLSGSPFMVEGGLPSREQRIFAEKLAETRDCRPAGIQERMQRATLRYGDVTPTLATASSIKSASVADEPGEGLARQYALYKVAFLLKQSVKNNVLPLTSRAVVLQNHIMH